MQLGSWKFRRMDWWRDGLLGEPYTITLDYTVLCHSMQLSVNDVYIHFPLLIIFLPSFLFFVHSFITLLAHYPPAFPWGPSVSLLWSNLLKRVISKHCIDKQWLPWVKVTENVPQEYEKRNVASTICFRLALLRLQGSYRKSNIPWTLLLFSWAERPSYPAMQKCLFFKTLNKKWQKIKF